MRLDVRIRSADPRSWDELLRDAPQTFLVTRRDAEIVLRRAAGAATGVRLGREDGAHVVSLPAFANADDISLACGLAPQIARMTGGTIDPAGDLDARCERFMSACVEAAVRSPREDAFVVDGAVRPFYIGKDFAMLCAALSDTDAYASLAHAIGAVQLLAPPTKMPEAERIRTPDGEIASYVRWDPREETLVPRCDYVLVRESETTQIRVPRARVGQLVRHPTEDGVVFGARLDEFQWLMGAQDEQTARAITERAASLGARLRLR